MIKNKIKIRQQINNLRCLAIISLILFVIFTNFISLNKEQTNSSPLVSDNYPITIQPIPKRKNTPCEWVFMVYLDGDNNLERAAIEDFNELEEGYSAGRNISVLVLIDRAVGYDVSNGNWKGTRLYQILPDSDSSFNSILLEDKGEMNMGDGETVEFFLNYTFANFPAEKYCLCFWDHGGGVNGLCLDDESENDFLTMDEMQKAIEDSEAGYGEKLDIISHDACLMNVMEVGFELRNLADYFVASEDSVPNDGYNYKTLMEDLCANPTWTGLELAEAMIASYEETNTYNVYTTLAALDLSVFSTCLNQINNFAQNLTNVILDGQGNSINRAFQDTYDFYDFYFIDFRQFISHILSNTTLMSLYPGLNIAAIDVENKINELIVANYSHSSYDVSLAGVSIFMPVNNSINQPYIRNYISSSDRFLHMDWQAYTKWDEFLNIFYSNDYGLTGVYTQDIKLNNSTGIIELLQGESMYYLLALEHTGIYEITANISNGDADIYLRVAGTVVELAHSLLYNPDDSSIEKIRGIFSPGLVIIEVYGFTTTSFNLVMTEFELEEITIDTHYTGEGGSPEGIYVDTDYHFKQTLDHFYQITLTEPNDYYFIVSYDNTEVDFDLIIYDENYNQLDSSYSVTNYDQIMKSISGETYFLICISGFSGYGSYDFYISLESLATHETNFISFSIYYLPFVFLMLYFLNNRKKR
ncbi:MAG: clostripain-related cysteine peptidase [Asgard group archaeon]|nr:clostripain-related cysteine peptidase [Asgard group archaeon]